MKKFYVTTAIDYVNSRPHVGHSYQKIIADILARFHRLKGEDVFFLTGTDEHGQKVNRAAEEAGLSPKEFADKMSVYFKNAWKALNVMPDRFIRTTDKDHEKVAQDITKMIWKNGDIYKGFYEGLYCTGCEAYFTERDAVDGKCPIHKRDLEVLKEETYFFSLSKYQEKLLDHYEKHPEFILPFSRRNEIINRVKEGLKDLSITRTSFSWGIQFPFDKNHSEYVWWEALINYVSGIGWPGKKFKKYWPADAHLLGVDNGWFHCVIWPAMLMSAGIRPPKTVFIHGFLTINGQKISKSLGNVIDPNYLVEKYGADAIRFFLVRNITFGQDGDFSTDDLIERVNNELVSNLANFCYRTLSFIQKTGSKIKSVGKSSYDRKVLKEVEEKVKLAEKAYGGFELEMAVRHILEIGDTGNSYFQESEPWVLAKRNKKRCDEVLALSANIVKKIAILLKPITPVFSKKIEKQLNVGDLAWKDLYKDLENHKIGKPEIVYRKIDRIDLSEPFAYLDLRVGEITSVEDHPEAEKLYVLRVELGKEKRTLVAGLKGHYSKKELEGKRIVVVANLKPAKLRGIESKGMLLAADDGKRVGLLLAEGRPGEDVVVEGISKRPVGLLDLKEFSKIELAGRKGKAYYGKKVLKTGKGKVWVDRNVEGKVR